MAKVTVIVPNYNHERFLKLRLDSILTQTYQDFEVIILDDHSTDNSKAIIEGYREHPRIIDIIYNEYNSGSPFHQWIKGIKQARSEYIWIAESDDYADPEFLASLMQLIDRYPNVAIAYSNSHKINDAGGHLEELYCYMDVEFKKGTEEVKDHLCHYNTITNASSCVIRTEYALQAISGLEKFRTCGDWIFYVRVLQHGNLAYSCEKLNHYRWHAQSVSFTASKTWIYMAEGINVIRYIDYNRVHFSMKEYMALCKAWIKKTIKISSAYIFRSVWVLLLSTYRFFAARLMLSIKG